MPERQWSYGADWPLCQVCKNPASSRRRCTHCRGLGAKAGRSKNRRSAWGEFSQQNENARKRTTPSGQLKPLKRELATLKTRVQQETAESESLAARLQTAEATCCECEAAWAARAQQDETERHALRRSLQEVEAICWDWEAAWAAHAQQDETERHALRCRLQEAEAVNGTTETRVQQEMAEARSLEARLQAAEDMCWDWEAACAARAQQYQSDWHALQWRLRDAEAVNAATATRLQTAEATSVEQAAKIWRAEEQLLQLLAGLRTAGLGSECAAVRIGEALLQNWRSTAQSTRPARAPAPYGEMLAR